MPRPGRFTPGQEIGYPLYRRLGGPEGRSGWVWKISTPKGFNPRTVQPVASRYADYTTPVHVLTSHFFISIPLFLNQSGSTNFIISLQHYGTLLQFMYS